MEIESINNYIEYFVGTHKSLELILYILKSVLTNDTINLYIKSNQLQKFIVKLIRKIEIIEFNA